MSERPALLLLPGLNCTQALWAHQIAALSDRVVCHVPDMRGHTELRGLAKAILETAPARFSLAGLSMGGYVALEIMRRAPERVIRLALIDTQARGDDDETGERRRAQIALAEGGGFERVIELQWPRLVGPANLDNVDLRARVRAMAMETGPDAFVRQQTLILNRPDARPNLSQIRCPTHVLVGEDDLITPPPVAEEMAKAIPTATMQVIPRAGHLAPMEEPDAVTAQLREWLDQ
ncbi:MAG: alpha/beta fold hydrolase [Labrys sp. (in: a-proteobacteria)]